MANRFLRSYTNFAGMIECYGANLHMDTPLKFTGMVSMIGVEVA